ncbi:Exostosin family protein [Striga hermonthica]|uniref:Exostosin family protein n=1 Tax=Striga hermonthica TaxID=68872 RepID=A0A9N7N8Z5_STRHE|nr:Exostosin family protein [Striga hermonthica]
MGYSLKIRTLIQIVKRNWLLLVGLVALTHLLCQSLLLTESPKHSPPLKTLTVDSHHEDSASSLHNESLSVRRVKSARIHDMDAEDNEGFMKIDKEEKTDSDLDADGIDDDINFVEDETNVNVDVGEDYMIKPSDREHDHHGSLQVGKNVSSRRFFMGQLAMGNSGAALDSESSKISYKDVVSHSVSLSPLVVSPAKPLLTESVVQKKSESVISLSLSNKIVKKKMRCDMPPKTVTSVEEMEKLLVRHRARSRAMRPRWSSERDQEILSAKQKIENAPVLKSDRELYAPLFRNVSMFKRSYELMERVLKIYVYKEGDKPIFHQPILKGLYASEGWFMKLMEGNKNFIVKDPRKAHLFYMPFSSRMLEYTLYVRNSHNRTNLRQYLKDYSEKIAAKYRFWNRTGGADHFLVACHDWAPYETRHHMEHCIKALCNADVTTGFKIGRDVSLPETYVRSARNPLRDLGGKPPSQRQTLAFYAGSMHGYLRPILLELWANKEPDMKILGRMPPGVASKMNYIQLMKSSRYCICPKGYEVNSPRIVEAIFYECVPVIISDNFVLPFFEVMNWDAFSVIIAEKDIPNLKTILSSISEKKYLDMQLNVRKVQRHFLWHPRPMKYDLFHMTLHSIWYNRVFQIKPR